MNRTHHLSDLVWPLEGPPSSLPSYGPCPGLAQIFSMSFAVFGSSRKTCTESDSKVLKTSVHHTEPRGSMQQQQAVPAGSWWLQPSVPVSSQRMSADVSSNFTQNTSYTSSGRATRPLSFAPRLQRVRFLRAATTSLPWSPVVCNSSTTKRRR